MVPIMHWTDDVIMCAKFVRWVWENFIYIKFWGHDLWPWQQDDWSCFGEIKNTIPKCIMSWKMFNTVILLCQQFWLWRCTGHVDLEGIPSSISTSLLSGTDFFCSLVCFFLNVGCSTAEIIYWKIRCCEGN